MFRKSRAPTETSSNDVNPSVGRPPTPPATPAKTPFTLAVPPSVPPPKMPAAKTKSNKPVPLPTIGRQGPTINGKKATPKGKPNGNIMSFFKKSEEEEAELFVNNQHGGIGSQTNGNGHELLLRSVEDDYDNPPDSRFNESEGPVKRRKTGGTSVVEDDEDEVSTPGQNGHMEEAQPSPKNRGPFFEESDSEQEAEQPEAIISMKQASPKSDADVETDDHREMAIHRVPGQQSIHMEADDAPKTVRDPAKLPTLLKEETSYGYGVDDFKDFEGMDDFDEDLFEEGDEYMEQRYMEEQARLEAEHDEKDCDPWPPEHESAVATTEGSPACPICNISLAGASEQDAGIHVNNCLDGNPTPLPQPKKAPPPQPPRRHSSKEGTPISTSANHFVKPSRAPKPGQANPFALGQPSTNGGSAFNKLMSGHAEDAAWAEAAASENASRGKPSYQRTCPFYKILPGLSICVDAFRYGAVQGCQAYFLSHFHSDHYIGLTSHWSHGPIYCSKVTANLVRQQLRVDPKYVVDLEFEKTVEVQGTTGVKVTMIPANHCPGSSLYLFEKAVGKKFNGQPKVQRILHCGDFRACQSACTTSTADARCSRQAYRQDEGAEDRRLLSGYDLSQSEVLVPKPGECHQSVRGHVHQFEQAYCG